MTTLLFTGCNRKTNEEPNKEKKVYNVELSEAQKKYLMNEQMTSEDALKYMDREGINWNLLGTGLELYNPTSGVEVNGLKYKQAKGYDNFFFKIIFELNNDEVYMKYVVFSHKKGERAQVFSVLYDRYLMDAYLENDSYTMEKQLNLCAMESVALGI